MDLITNHLDANKLSALHRVWVYDNIVSLRYCIEKNIRTMDNFIMDVGVGGVADDVSGHVVYGLVQDDGFASVYVFCSDLEFGVLFLDLLQALFLLFLARLIGLSLY
ncbi:hypothetical protein Tco_0121726 [Tanacetum coccineum]